jgi:hypothetical protein
MKSINTSLLQCVIVIGALLASPIQGTPAKSTTGSDPSGDPGWPREKYSNGTRLIIYQPQVDDWKNFQELSWRMAVSLTPKGGKEVVGVVEMKGHTDVDNVANGYDRSGASSYNRSSGGDFSRSGGSQMQDLDREAQNRSRGDFSSQRFQGFQRGGFNRFGGGGGFGGFDRSGGGGFGGFRDGGGFRGRR